MRRHISDWVLAVSSAIAFGVKVTTPPRHAYGCEYKIFRQESGRHTRGVDLVESPALSRNIGMRTIRKKLEQVGRVLRPSLCEHEHLMQSGESADMNEDDIDIGLRLKRNEVVSARAPCTKIVAYLVSNILCTAPLRDIQ